MSCDLRYGSLFSGIGGLDLGLDRAGFTPAWQCEIDEYATSVLERHWPDVTRYRDVHQLIEAAADAQLTQPGVKQRRRLLGRMGGERKLDQRPVPRRVDLIAGGFPCQPVSLAGSKKGMEDPRWLWPAFRRVLELLRPTYALIENVRGLASTNNGRAFRGILADLAALGFDAEWHALPAAAFGAPHLRYRLFIVAYSQSNRWNEGRTQPEGQQGRPDPTECGPTPTHPHQPGPQEREGQPGDLGQKQPTPAVGDAWRSTEPCVRRGNPRLPHRVDRLRCLGNSVVPQIAEFIGLAIMDHARKTTL